jgi:hypothetical protein
MDVRMGIARRLVVVVCALVVYAAGVLMVVNERWGFRVGLEGADANTSASFVTGAIVLHRARVETDIPGGWYAAGLTAHGPEDPNFGAYAWRPSVIARDRYTRVVVPWWGVAGPALGVAGVLCVRERRARRRSLLVRHPLGLRSLPGTLRNTIRFAPKG